MAGVSYYQKSQYMTDLDHVLEFESYAARLSRYKVNQSYYDNTVFSTLHSFSQAIKATQPVLYDYIQAIYNPAYRLTETYRMNIWGGVLDQDAGPTGAIPFIVGKSAQPKEVELRAVIAKILEQSNWATNKTVLPAQGARLGDCVLLGVDDVKKQQTRMEIVHPSEIEEADTDSRGFVKYYKRSYKRVDDDGKTSLYTETARHGEGEEITYETFRDGRMWQWPDNPGWTWTVPWGFIPLIIIQHANDGMKWGLSEFHTLIPKINGVEDKASILHDAMRKAAENPGLLSGLTPPDPAKAKFAKATKTTDNPEPERESRKFVYGPVGSTFTSMVFPLDVSAIGGEIQNAMRDWERDYPELIADVWGADARVDGVLTAKGKVEKKIIERRSAYDGRLVDMLRMLIAIGGDAGYPGYEGFDLTSYSKGLLDFSVGPRPVFPESEEQKTARVSAFWDGWSKLDGTSVPFRAYALSHGWTAAQVDEYEAMSGAKKLADKTAVNL
jgi:hypothetical protein